MIISKIISGGQTGVDRAGLDAAMACGIAVGGWCPAERKSEDGVIPEKYPLQETVSSRYEVRTKRNVRDSDGTLIITNGPPTGGTLLTIRTAKQLRKPTLLVDFASNQSGDQIDSVLDWIKSNTVRQLNVAGPRESGCPGIEKKAGRYLQKLFEAAKRKSLS